MWVRIMMRVIMNIATIDFGRGRCERRTRKERSVSEQITLYVMVLDSKFDRKNLARPLRKKG